MHSAFDSCFIFVSLYATPKVVLDLGQVSLGGSSRCSAPGWVYRTTCKRAAVEQRRGENERAGQHVTPARFLACWRVEASVAPLLQRYSLYRLGCGGDGSAVSASA